MTAVGSQQNGSLRPDSGSMNTIPDPRARTPSPTQEPDLSNEVSMLSTKLINAINHSTNLDDTLQHTRHDLDAVRKQLAQAQLDVQRHADMITNGVLVKKAAVDAAMVQLRAEMAEARQQREAAEKGKKEMETELENLTSALFEEANTVCTFALPDRLHQILTRPRWWQQRAERAKLWRSATRSSVLSWRIPNYSSPRNKNNYRI